MTLTTQPPRAGRPPYWEQVAESWRDERPYALWRRHSDAVNLALLERWLPTGPIDRLLKTDVFDEVCGDGLYPLLAARAARVIGIDISLAAQQAATARHPALTGVAADVRHLPFADASLDVVVSNSTLDHFATADDIGVSLREVGRVLRPGGSLILTLDNLANPAIGLRNALPFGIWRALRLVPYYVGATLRPADLQQAVTEAGFEVVTVNAVMHCPRVLGVALAGLVERWGGPAAGERLLGRLLAWELLATWPTRFLTGHFVAIRAMRR